MSSLSLTYDFYDSGSDPLSCCIQSFYDSGSDPLSYCLQFFQVKPVFVTEDPAGYSDHVDEPSHAEQAEGEQIQAPHAGPAHIEIMGAAYAKKETEKQRCDSALGRRDALPPIPVVACVTAAGCHQGYDAEDQDQDKKASERRYVISNEQCH